MSSSFVKKSARRQTVLPAGTWPSVLNGQLLTSAGLPSWDELLGGGMAIGTVCALLEDEHTRYAQVLAKCFLAQGLACGHELFLASADPTPQEIFRSLPAQVSQDPETVEKASSSNAGDMKIAWRYQNLPSAQPRPAGESTEAGARHFDLAATVAEETLSQGKVTGVEVPLEGAEGSDDLMLPAHRALLERIMAVVVGYRVGQTSSQQPSILRISLLSFGSMLWQGTTQKELTSCTLFLHALRGLARTAYCCVLVTIPAYLLPAATVRRLEHSADCVIALESFAGTPYEQSAHYKDYHGLVHMVKPMQVNTLVPSHPDTTSLVFKLRRRKFVIEKLHLPPDLGETVSRSTADKPKTSTGQGAGSLCGPKTKINSLDF